MIMESLWYIGLMGSFQIEHYYTGSTDYEGLGMNFLNTLPRHMLFEHVYFVAIDLSNETLGGWTSIAG